MANYSQHPGAAPQAPYGMPFPVQHPAPALQAGAQGGPSDPRQAPSAEALQNMWNWQALNLQAYNQNAQQPPFPLWPPPPGQQQSEYTPLSFPPPFLQNGFVPPPPPGSNFYPPPPIPQAHLHTVPTPTSVPPFETSSSYLPQQPIAPTSMLPPQRPITVKGDRIADDKEDGEVSDGDRISRSPAGLAFPIPEPPRSVPFSSHDPFRKGTRVEARPQDVRGTSQPRQNNDHDHYAGGKMYTDHTISQGQQLNIMSPNGTDKIARQREEADRFVKLLYDHNFGFDSLAKEGLDAPPLKDVFRRNHLPLPPERYQAPTKAHPQESSAQTQVGVEASIQASKPTLVPEPKVNGGLTPNATNNHSALRYPDPPVDITKQTSQAKPTPAVKTNAIQAPPVKSVSSPIDRKDYIARLQAAKMAKQPVGTKAPSPPPSKTIPVVDPNPMANTKSTETSTIGNADKAPKLKQPATEDEKARKTELIRQRLEAMKAKQIAASPATPKASNPSTPSATSTIILPTSSLQHQTQAQNLTPQHPRLTQNHGNATSSQTFQSPSFSGIPGLFMSASSNHNTPTPVRTIQSPQLPSPPKNPQIATASSTKRRAVASDLDDVSTSQSSGPLYTRPLGQPPHEHDGESMIIEVSDDESGGSEMDLDDDQAASKPVVSPPNGNRNGQHVLRNLPPLTDFPSRPASVRPASSAVSTPGTQTPTTIARKEELQKKERDLAELKQSLVKKLAEQRQRNKTSTAASSPKTQKSSTPAFSKQTDSRAYPPHQPISAQSNQPVALRTSSNLYDQAMTRESKKRRRAEIESGLPTLEAEIASNTARMAQITKEMEELRATNEKISQDKENLIKELEGLGIDTDGMPHAELQAKKAEIDQIAEYASSAERANNNTPAEISNATNATHSQNSPTMQPGTTVIDTMDHHKASQQPEGIPNSEDLAHIPKIAATIVTVPQSATQPKVASLHNADDIVSQEPIMNKAPISNLPSVQIISPLKEPALVDSVKTTISEVENGSTTPLDDEEDFYSPEPTVTVVLNDGSTIPEPLEPVVRSPSEQSEADMSESSSSDNEDEYEPPVPQIVPATGLDTSVKDRRATGSPVSMPSDDEEMYEPPEPVVDVEALVVRPDSVTETGALNLQSIEEDGAMDISTSSSDSSDSSDSAPGSPINPTNNGSTSFDNVPDLFIAGDDAAPESHLATVQTITEPISTSGDVAEPTSFVPYESPLRKFKSYRYHPSFSHDVSGGFLSMTYSHQIDPETPLCQFESVGGTCNDPKCTDQHFRGMNITGEKLLVQLGTANPGKTPEEKQLWIDGLRGVLRELRQKNIKDPNGIAVEIANYRRQFLNDDTRVVNL